jgi:hypothetical protein
VFQYGQFPLKKNLIVVNILSVLLGGICAIHIILLGTDNWKLHISFSSGFCPLHFTPLLICIFTFHQDKPYRSTMLSLSSVSLTSELLTWDGLKDFLSIILDTCSSTSTKRLRERIREQERG